MFTKTQCFKFKDRLAWRIHVRKVKLEHLVFERKVFRVIFVGIGLAMDQIEAQNKSICLRYISSDGSANAQRYIPLNIYLLCVTMVTDTANTTRVVAEN